MTPSDGPYSVQAHSAGSRAEGPLAWLRRRRDKSGAPLIGDEQFQAGMRLASDFWRAQMTPRTTTLWTGMPSSGQRGTAGAGGDMRDAAVAAQDRVRKALAAVGPDFACLLIDVCCHEVGLEEMERRARLPDRSGKVVLVYALNALARHYGLMPPAGAAWTAREGVRHWGAEDYRPTMDGSDA